MALWREDHVEVRQGDVSRLHAVRLPGDLTTMLSDVGLRWSDVTRLAVVGGPGGFTGLRVGLATIQGLAMALGIGVVVRSSLELIARAARQQDAECELAGAWMQGMRGEVFTALYGPQQASGPLTPVLAPLVDTPARAAASWAPVVAGERVAVAGDALPSSGVVLRECLPDADLRPLETPPLAGVLARLAAIPGVESVSAQAVLPTYVRRPDAVVARLQAGQAVPDLP